MKKTLTLVVSLGMALAFCGCQSGNEKDPAMNVPVEPGRAKPPPPMAGGAGGPAGAAGSETKAAAVPD